jgi:hypothetical protein
VRCLLAGVRERTGARDAADATAGEKREDASDSAASAAVDAAARVVTFLRETGVADDKLATCVLTFSIARRAIRDGSFSSTFLPHSSHGVSITFPFFIFLRQYKPLRVKRPSGTRQPELAVFFKRGPLGVALSALAAPASLY